MDTEQIRDFLAVARYKNFSKAAESLYIGQPALSRRISALERQLGVQLFLRSNKAVELTKAGEILREEAQHIIEQLEQLEEKMQAAEQGVTGSIRVTTMGHLSDRVLQVIKRTIAALPDCEVELDVLIPNEQGDGMQPSDADVSFRLGMYSEDKTIQNHVIPLEDAPFSFLLPVDHPLARLTEIRPEDLKQEKLLLLKVPRVPVQIQSLLQAIAGQSGQSGLKVEGLLQNAVQHFRYALPVCQNHAHGCRRIPNGHERDQPFGDSPHALDAAQHGKAHCPCHGQTGEQRGNAKGILQAGGNGICLGHIAHSQRP